MSKSEIRRRDEIHKQAEKRQEIGIDAGRSQNADDPVEQPFASGSYRASKGSHSFASANREFDFSLRERNRTLGLQYSAN
jgi:hypothetical protein